MDDVTDGFRRRGNLAGGLFPALCEALLDTDPPRGVRLWHALEKAMRIRFVGLAGIDNLFHLPFRANESPAVLVLREELYSVRRNRTDKDYLEAAMLSVLYARLAPAPASSES